MSAFGVDTDAAGMERQAGEPHKICSVEGITEYRLDNGLKALLFPDVVHGHRHRERHLLRRLPA